MHRRILLLALAVGLCGWISAGNADGPEAKPERKADDPTEAAFGLERVWTIHLEIPAVRWEHMHPTRAMRMFGPPQPPRDPPKDPPKEDPKEEVKEKRPDAPPRGGFGYDFPYVQASVEIDGKKMDEVGVRFKGNSSYMMTAQGIKRPFKIDFDRFDKKQSFHGLKMVNLANNAMEPTHVRESIAYMLFREAGVPAPRTAFVELYLTVPGKYQRDYAGLYTLIEQVDRTFLKRHFKNGKGMLLKPERIKDIPYLGTDWTLYDEYYGPEDPPDQKSKERLFDFARLINFADDAEFNQSIGKFMDLDGFLRFLAVCSATTNLDSFVGLGHNYYLYLNPEDNRFVFIPWDLNGTFCGLMLGGNAEQQMDWSIKRPYTGSNRLTERILAVKENEEAYRKHLRELTERIFNEDKLLAQIDKSSKAVQKAIEKEKEAAKPPGPGGMGPRWGNPPELKTFVRKRAESLVSQLDGKSQGKEIRMGFGAPMSRGWGSQLARPITEAADEDKDGKLSKDELTAILKRLYAEADPDKKNAIDEKALADVLAKLIPRPRFGPPGGGGQQPSNAIPAGHLAGFVFYHSTGKEPLSTEKLVAFGEKLFGAADKDGDGLLESKELTDGLNAMPSAPQIFSMPKAAAPRS